MGWWLEMLQQTDIRIAEEQAGFALPEAKQGLIAGAGSTMRLERQIPYAKGHEIAGVIVANGPLSVSASKASAVETGWLPEDVAGAIERRYASLVTRSNDAKEGMAAFGEKRTPNFTGT